MRKVGQPFVVSTTAQFADEGEQVLVVSIAGYKKIPKDAPIKIMVQEYKEVPKKPRPGRKKDNNSVYGRIRSMSVDDVLTFPPENFNAARSSCSVLKRYFESEYKTHFNKSTNRVEVTRYK